MAAVVAEAVVAVMGVGVVVIGIVVGIVFAVDAVVVVDML